MFLCDLNVRIGREGSVVKKAPGLLPIILKDPQPEVGFFKLGLDARGANIRTAYFPEQLHEIHFLQERSHSCQQKSISKKNLTISISPPQKHR
jgi:hypothetical protein